MATTFYGVYSTPQVLELHSNRYNWFWSLVTFCLCWNLLSGMRLFNRCNEGTIIFEQVSRSGHSATSPGALWPISVYTDVPSDAYAALEHDQPLHKLCIAVLSTTTHYAKSNADKRLAMLYEGLCLRGHGGQLGTSVLLDTGATSNFVSPKVLQRLSISYTATPTP